jgi:hypothetical protein
MALAAASLWKQVLGVQATLLNEEYKVFLQNRERKILTQVFQAGWISDYADAYSFLNLFRSGHGNNYYGYSNSMYDSLLDEVAAERIPSRRRRLMFEAERLLLTDMPFIPVYSYVTKRMVNPRLKGWESNVMDHHYSKHMFFLKAASEEYMQRRQAEKLQTVQPEDAEAMSTEEGAWVSEPAGEGETIQPAGQEKTPAEADDVSTARPDVEPETESQADGEKQGGGGQ